MLIIDSQIHVYAPSRVRSPLPGVRMLNPRSVLAEMDRAGVSRAVLIPPRTDVTTNEYAMRAAKRQPKRFGVMGKLLVDRAESREMAEGWTSTQTFGFRVGFPPGKSSPEDVDWLWTASELRDFPIMVWAPGRLRELKNAARRHPQARIIVDHLGMAPEDRGNQIRAAIDDLLPLAGLDNIAVKASSLPAHSSGSYPFRDMHDPLREVVSSFGPTRVFWGSDLSTIDVVYEDAVRMFTEAMEFPASTLDQIMGLGLARWLRWEVE
jgi:L-fuconolactonase